MWVQNMELLIILSLHSFYAKYSSKHPVLEHPQPVFLY
jgi:hypothetical protein